MNNLSFHPWKKNAIVPQNLDKARPETRVGADERRVEGAWLAGWLACQYEELRDPGTK